MNLLCWNARGLGSPGAFRNLQKLVRDESPDILFISESKLQASRCSKWKAILGMEGCFVVNSEGRKGGLILLWSNTVSVCVRSFSAGHIDSLIQGKGREWRFTGFYGNPRPELRRFSWELLKKLAGDQKDRNMAWLVGGDWNEILFDEEKDGGARKSWALMNEFQEALEEAGLEDLGFHGQRFTWANGWEPPGFIQERLDRFCANDLWQNMFPDFGVHNLPYYKSDHRPI